MSIAHILYYFNSLILLGLYCILCVPVLNALWVIKDTLAQQEVKYCTVGVLAERQEQLLMYWQIITSPPIKLGVAGVGGNNVALEGEREG